jgi:hypothetical protein
MVYCRYYTVNPDDLPRVAIVDFWTRFYLIPEVIKIFGGSDEKEDDPQAKLSQMQRQASAAGIKGPPSVLRS